MSVPSAVRVPEQTVPDINEAIRQATERNIECYAPAEGKSIDARLRQLDREWDVERALAFNAAALTLLSGLLAASGRRRWLMVPGAVGWFLMQHALQGWCPPVSVLRRLGFRTRREIALERYALKVLRGDYREIPSREKERAAQAAELLAVQEK